MEADGISKWTRRAFVPGVSHLQRWSVEVTSNTGLDTLPTTRCNGFSSNANAFTMVERISALT